MFSRRALNTRLKIFYLPPPAVYGRSTELPLLEERTAEPISPYGASKVAGEALVSYFKSKIPNCLSLRFFNVYGKGQSLEDTGVISKFLERLSEGLPPIIYGNGFHTRDFISVNDVVNAIVLEPSILSL